METRARAKTRNIERDAAWRNPIRASLHEMHGQAKATVRGDPGREGSLFVVRIHDVRADHGEGVVRSARCSPANQLTQYGIEAGDEYRFWVREAAVQPVKKWFVFDFSCETEGRVYVPDR